MRLASFRGVELSRDSLETRNAGAECRVVAYVAEQHQPVYISEPRTPEVSGNKAITKFNEVSLAKSPLRRSFRIAVQLWIKDNAWSLEDQWIIDLRQLKQRKSHAHEEIVILSETGPMVLGSSALEPPSLPRSNASSITDTSQARKELPQGFALRLFGWSSTKTAGLVLQDPKAETGSGDLVSLSYATLVDLWTLQHSLNDAQAASLTVSEEINSIIANSILPLRDQERAMVRRCGAVRKQCRVAQEKATQVRALAVTERQSYASVNEGLQQSLRIADAECAERPRTTEPEATQSDKLERTSSIADEQARLALQLLEIFPIDPVENGKFHFTIRGLALPSVFAINHYDPIQVGAALGFVAQVVVLLSQYLDVALPYPITVYGSQSFIADNISAIKHGSNKFPLWTRGALLYRVEYALYLLHKDIEQLMNAMNLAVADLKQTLANLKNLLLVISIK